ncbi:DUF3040 domain-containing protein [Actinomycetospora flava]|uniref:DUF3040 domain-containing protein n=1 Tax=Actinomycetospora flava TaxID=3129232 RepID=A0ABU8M601_9PSEU
MPLSEHEQRLLEQIERALYDEDPKFASTVRGGKLRRPSRRRRIQGVALFVIGVVMLVLGVVLFSTSTVGVIVSVVGFLAMFGGAVLAITSFGARKKEAAAEGEAAAPGAAGEKERSRFTSRMEERFRRRFEQE